MSHRRIRSRFCSVPGCGINKKSKPEVAFFGLPANPRRAECWLKQIGLKKQTDRYTYVCEDHFDEALINRTNPSKRRLDLDAFPTLKLPPRPGNCSSNNEHANTLEVPQVEKTNFTENVSPQPEKEKKIETNVLTQRSLEGGAALPLQLPSQPILIKVCSTLSKEVTMKTGREVPGEKRSAKAPLKFIEYVYKGNDSKPKVLPDKLVEHSCKEINEGAIQSKYQQITDAETQQETVRPTGAITTSKNIQKIQAQMQNLEKDDIQGTITGASTFTLKLHEIQLMIKYQSLHSSKAFKQLSLKLYLRFPNEYRFLYKLLNAPPKSELRDVFNDSVISIDRVALFAIYLTLKAKFMTVKQKQCFLCIGELKIKPRIYYDIKKDNLLGIHDLDEVLKPEPATKAVVLILQAIFDEWKQPIAIGYLGNNSPSIRPWVDENIKNLSQIGFNVRAVVHRDLSCFTNDVHINKKKTYCINDMTFLFNNFYYNFMKAGYNFDGRFVATGQDIVDYYKLDSKKQIPLTPKLTNEVIYPANVEKLNIKSVMEVFSLTTAAAISAYIDFNLIDGCAKSTVGLIIKINKLYKILNTGRLDDKSKKGFVGDPSELDFLEEMLVTFDTLKLCNQLVDESIHVSHRKLVEMFKQLIKSTLSLWDNLKIEKYECLPIWRFTTDAVGLFFDQVQKHSSSITKPTAKEIDSIFKQTAIIHLLKNPRQQFELHCMENVLIEFHTICNGFKFLNDDYINRELATGYKICSLEYMTLEMRRKDGIIFLAGFLLKKCSEIHKCDDFKLYQSKTYCDIEALSMCESIMDDIRKNISVLPSSEFIEFVEAMEISFRTFFNKDVLCVVNKKILNSLLKFMDFVDVRMPCPCFPVLYVKKLYSRLRMYQMLKYNNELIRTKICRRLMINKL